jgi:hypothetical protein
VHDREDGIDVAGVESLVDLLKRLLVSKHHGSSSGSLAEAVDILSSGSGSWE